VLAKHKLTVRCIPLDDEPGFEEQVAGKCLFSGKPTKVRAVISKAY
jgi:hypothetical protein